MHYHRQLNNGAPQIVSSILALAEQNGIVFTAQELETVHKEKTWFLATPPSGNRIELHLDNQSEIHLYYWERDNSAPESTFIQNLKTGLQLKIHEGKECSEKY